MRLLNFLWVLAAAASAAAQPACHTTLSPFDGAGELRRRADELTSGARADFGLLRTTLACMRDSTAQADKASVQPDRATPGRGRVSFSYVAPQGRAIYADGVPDTRGNGSLWAGRGVSALVRGGLTADWHAVHLAIIPELGYSANQPFDVLPGLDPARSTLSSPFYAGPYSADLPSRMGGLAVTQLSLGQSALWAEAGPVAFGWSSSNLWWGSGVRDALFIGNNAAGIPRVFVRTLRPIPTAYGRFSGEYFLGVLTESRFFDSDPQNDRRSLSAFALTWSPPHSDDFVVGIARGVAQVASPNSGWIGSHLTDALHSQRGGQSSELTALFTRYLSPASGVRAYAELGWWNRVPTVREFLSVPYEGLAYQVGIERLVRAYDATWVFLAEAMNIEQPVDVTERPPVDFYTGGTAQGWTQRGQLLGAGIGPGGQSQYLSADMLLPFWSLGLYAERVRWNEDALFRQYLPYSNRHDVTMRMGARLGVNVTRFDVLLDASWGHRLNYLFQNNAFIPAFRTVDVRIPELRLTFTPTNR